MEKFEEEAINVANALEFSNESSLTFRSSLINLAEALEFPMRKEKISKKEAELPETEEASQNSSNSAIALAPESEKKVSSLSPTPQNGLNDVPLKDEPYTCFTKAQRVTIFAIVIFIGFLGPMAGNIYIPALPLLQQEFKVGTTTINSTVSVFMAIFSVGPLFWGMFADSTGRKFLFITSLLLLVLVNILLATVPANIGALYTLRVFQAFGSSSAISLGTGTVTDITPPKHRGKAIGYFMMGPNMGPILAPIISGLILMKGEPWRWLFGFTSIMSGIALCVVLVILPETLRCIVGNADQRWKNSENFGTIAPAWEECALEDPENTRIDDVCESPRWRIFPDIGIQKPVNTGPRFQFLYPAPAKPSIKMYWSMVKMLPVTISSISTALLFANYYAFSVTLSHFLQTDYHMSNLAVGASYVCPGVAMLVGSQSGGHLSDYLRQKWVNRHADKKFPLEYRLSLQLPGILINTAGCIGYGWAINKHYHLVVVLVFSALSAFGLTWCSNTTMTYLSELLSKRTAGAIAVSSLFRNVGATVSSSIIMKLCHAMGVGWCFTGLGLCNLFSLFSVLYLLRYSGHWQGKISHNM
ncbi:DTR1 (YBR180W) [Zygosaccharomyces parabailii]|nr:DTR1 (YBR180W) [Zygosaccharomyces parabailii]